MRTSRFLAACVAAALAACSGDTTAPEPTVVSVTVSPATSVIEGVGTTVQFSATAKDGSGATVSGKTATWTSSNVAVATVSSTGLATSVAAGQANITATVDGVRGSSTLTVSPAPQGCTNAKTVNLAVGGAQTYDGTDCIVLPAGVSGDRYRVAVVRPATTGAESDVITATLNVVGLGVTQAPEPTVTPSLAGQPLVEIPGLSQAAIQKAMRISEATERYHLKLREWDAAIAREAGYDVLPDLSRSGLARVVQPAASPTKMTFDISTGSSCTPIADSKRTGLLIGENDDLVIYQDSTQNATKPISEGLAQKMTTYFTAYVKDMIPVYWGNVRDVDGNGKIIIFATPKVTSEVAAFVWTGDYYPTATCAASNQREIIYFNTDLIRDMEATPPAYQALETLAHEAKHLVTMYNRIVASGRAGSAQFHPGWVEEGTAEISGEIASRIAWAATGGPALTDVVTKASFQASGPVTPENYGVAIKMARMVWYLSSQPNGLVVSPTGAAQGHNIYASGWAFHRWLGDAYGNAASAPMAEAPMFKALMDSVAPVGTVGLASQTGKSFLTLYEEFVNAVMLHRTTAPEPARHFTTYDLITATAIFSNPNPPGDFPWPVTNVGETPTASFKTANYSGSIGVTGIRIHDFLSNGSGTGAQITLNSSGKPAKLQVVRLR